MAHCPELTEADLAQLAAPDPDDRLPASIGEQILDVIWHMTYTDSSMNTSWSSGRQTACTSPTSAQRTGAANWTLKVKGEGPSTAVISPI